MGTDTFDRLREMEFARLDDPKNRSVYLDFTGSGLYPGVLLDRQEQLLRNSVLGNPHSSNPASVAATELVERTRKRTLAFFHASPSEYCVVFTSNATGAIKLVGESFPFEAASTFSLFTDNHNSVHGIREYARAAGATVRYLPLTSHMRVEGVHSYLAKGHSHAPNLFAYPAQSNFSGVHHSLAHVRCAHGNGWFVLLDAAAYVPTSRLDLSSVFPDFVAISFYKMFGLPTGVGALIVRKSALARLRRPWFAGGTVRYASVGNNVHALERGPQGFEDGTLNFLSIALVKDGLDFLESVGMGKIHDHVARLTLKLLVGMNHLRFADGQPMVRVYGPMSAHRRGGCVAFDVVSSRGKRRDPRIVEKAANARRISLRIGCFCNPGAAERALHKDLKREQSCLRSLGRDNVDIEHMSRCMGEFLGCVRVSLGISSNVDDINVFLSFLRNFADSFST